MSRNGAGCGLVVAKELGMNQPRALLSATTFLAETQGSQACAHWALGASLSRTARARMFRDPEPVGRGLRAVPSEPGVSSPGHDQRGVCILAGGFRTQETRSSSPAIEAWPTLPASRMQLMSR